jgi:alanine dehydrogenase
VCAVRTVESVAVFGRDEARRAAFAAEMTAALGVPVTAVASPELAAVGKDIVITATTSKEPVLRGEWVAPGTHLNLIGSNMRSKAEADVEVFRRAVVVAIDSKDQGRQEAGDFVAPMDAGVLQWADVLEFAPLLVGRYPGRESPADVTVFKSLGLGVQDIAVAVKVVELARAAGLGVPLPLG